MNEVQEQIEHLQMEREKIVQITQEMRNYIRFRIVPFTKGRGVELFSITDEMGLYPRMYPHFLHSDPHGMEYLRLQAFNYWIAVNPDVLDLENWWKMLKPGGYLIIVHHADVGHLMVTEKSWDMIKRETIKSKVDDQEYFWLIFQKTSNGKQLTSYKKPKPEKTACVVRYGGFGDMLQITGIFELLKQQGYHVTVITNEIGYPVVKLDPNVDEWIVQEKEQVPNLDLGEYWSVIEKDYDKFINLSESIEGSLLAMPQRVESGWPKNARHVYMDLNYTEWLHVLADVDRMTNQRFYPTQTEIDNAKKEIRKSGAASVCTWVLSGSSVHKVWPYMDNAIARILATVPGMHVWLVGDELSKNILQSGWEKEPRVHQVAFDWNIRQTLTFAEHSDCVIGPETGVMNCVANKSKIFKIVFLSHSTQENLTKHWVNTVALEPVDCHCYPCHMMHFGWDTCNRNADTGCADCATKIHLDAFWAAFSEKLRVLKIA